MGEAFSPQPPSQPESQNSLLRCSNCGREHVSKPRYCLGCGRMFSTSSGVQSSSPASGSPRDEQVTITFTKGQSPEAAQDKGKSCTNCGEENRSGANFCKNCGTKFSSQFGQESVESPKLEAQKCPNCGSTEVGSGRCAHCGTEFKTQKEDKWGPDGKMAKMVRFALDLDAQLDEEDRREEERLRQAQRQSASPPQRPPEATEYKGKSCPNCGLENRPGARFCRHCGRNLGA